MANVLITGATGNVGLEVIRCLHEAAFPHTVFAGVRNIETDSPRLAGFNAQPVLFDFEDSATYKPALSLAHTLFLLRPPQLSDVNKNFRPLINAAKESAIKHIVFLSVQGVENSSIFPHHKIEKLIVESKIPYTFLRPAYFMQNFSTTLRHDLVHNQLIFLPAGNAPFTIIDVRDIGAVAAKVLAEPFMHTNKSYDLTSNERLTFTEMAQQLSKGLGHTIRYQSPNLLRFFLKKRQENVPVMFILVMIMLHYLPRFQQPPPITDWVQKITGKEPNSFAQFIIDYKKELKNSVLI